VVYGKAQLVLYPQNKKALFFFCAHVIDDSYEVTRPDVSAAEARGTRKDNRQTIYFRIPRRAGKSVCERGFDLGGQRIRLCRRIIHSL
jgi:hypothetical protein